MLELKNLERGNHRLVIRKVLIQGAKVIVTMRPLDAKAKEVLRTYYLGSKGLCVFIGRVLGRFIETPTPELLKEIEGIVIVGEIIPARNPAYVDLSSVLETFTREQSHILILNPQSDDWKIGACKTSKKRET